MALYIVIGNRCPYGYEAGTYVRRYDGGYYIEQEVIQGEGSSFSTINKTPLVEIPWYKLDPYVFPVGHRQPEFEKEDGKWVFKKKKFYDKHKRSSVIVPAESTCPEAVEFDRMLREWDGDLND